MKNTFGTWQEQGEFITSYIPLKKEALESALHHYIDLAKQYSEIPEKGSMLFPPDIMNGHTYYSVA